MSSLGKGVQFALSPLHSKSTIFSPHQKVSGSQRGLLKLSSKRAEPFILVGLARCVVLAHPVSRQDFPPTQRAWSLQELNTNSTPIPSIGSDSPFVCFPSMSFEKQDANKQRMLQNLDPELKGLNLTHYR